MTKTTEPGVHKIVLPIGKTSTMELILDPDDHENVLATLDRYWPYAALMVRSALTEEPR